MRLNDEMRVWPRIPSFPLRGDLRVIRVHKRAAFEHGRGKEERVYGGGISDDISHGHIEQDSVGWLPSNLIPDLHEMSSQSFCFRCVSFQELVLRGTVFEVNVLKDHVDIRFVDLPCSLLGPCIKVSSVDKSHQQASPDKVGLD